MPISSIQDVYNFLDAIPSFKADGETAADFTLERFRDFCSAMGDPQDEFRSIHVAGTNGKGSTCQLLASIYEQSGYEVGCYTSPHLLDYRERFVINNQMISEEDLVLFFQRFESLIMRFELTYFEICTAVAFWWFARKEVDLAIIEVGLGGRLDATNIITPLASIITTVSMDHTQILGDSIAAITKEKAGIIKPGVPVVGGNVPPEARRVIKKRAKATHAPFHESVNLEPAICEGGYRLTDKGTEVTIKSTRQISVQAYNVAVAWQTAKILQADIPIKVAHIEAGIAGALNGKGRRARFEKLTPGLNWYFDGAHNLQAVQAMKQAVEAIQAVDQTTLVLSLMDDKVQKKMMLEFSEFKKIIYYTVPLGRAASIEEVRKWLPNMTSFPTDQASQRDCLKELQSELVIFAGSFYFYPTVRDWLSSMRLNR